MIGKTFTALSAIFIIQTVTSCFCPCHKYDDYEVYFNGVGITVLNFTSANETNNISRNSFGINIEFLSDIIQISSLSPRYMGFSSALACDCDGDYYFVQDPIASVEVFAINEESGEIMIADTILATYHRQQAPVLLEDFFSNGVGWGNSTYEFQFEPTEAELLPAATIFLIEAQLESGLILTDQTQVVNFID